MQKEISFDRTTNFTGRNGYFKCAGVEVLECEHNDTVMLSPITSKGNIGRCDIAVPIENLKALANTLLEIAGEDK